MLMTNGKPIGENRNRSLEHGAILVQLDLVNTLVLIVIAALKFRKKELRHQI